MASGALHTESDNLAGIVSSLAVLASAFLIVTSSTAAAIFT